MKQFIEQYERTLVLQPEAGKFGIEVEIASDKEVEYGGLKKWIGTHDGSIRGNWGMEFVLRTPLDRGPAETALKELWKRFDKDALDPNESCSTHIHLNIQQMTEVQVLNLIVLYLIFENALVRWCGDGRVGNLFCLRARDAEFVIDALENYAITGDVGQLHTDHLRYAALNLKALTTYGSLEFRSMRATKDYKDILNWMDIITQLEMAARQHDKPEDIIHAFSQGAEGAFARDTLDIYCNDILNYEGWEDDIVEGMRRVQPVAFGYTERMKREGVVADEEPVEERREVDELRPAEVEVQPEPRPNRKINPRPAGMPVLVERVQPDEEQQVRMREKAEMNRAIRRKPRPAPRDEF